MQIAAPLQQYVADRVGLSVWPVVMAISAMEAMAVYCWPFRREPAAPWLLAIQLFKALWLLALLCLVLDAWPHSPGFWFDLRYFSVLLVAIANFYFVSRISRLPANLHNRLLAVLVLLAGFGVVLTVVNHFTGLCWSVDGAGRLINGPWRRVEIGLTPVINLVGVGLTVRWVWQTHGLRRRQAAMILLANLISWTGPSLLLLPGFRWFAPLPFTFTVSGLMTTLVFLRLHTMGLLPLAREVVVDAMIDGMMVLDRSDLVVAMNPQAGALFAPGELAEGNPFARACELWPELAVFAASGGAWQVESERLLAGAPTIQRVTLSPLTASTGNLLGRVLIFKDITAERQRLGRELHDSGQIWTYLDSQSEAIGMWLGRGDLERAGRELDRMIGVVRENSFGMRESIVSLQSGVSEQVPLPRVLDELLDWYRRHCGIETRLDLAFDWAAARVPLTAQTQLLRIAQEALANIRKHARAGSVRIGLELAGGNFHLSIADDGQGFDPAAESAQGHFGLRTMRERAQAIGAGFEVHSTPGKGSRIEIRLPLGPGQVQTPLPGAFQARG